MYAGCNDCMVTVMTVWWSTCDRLSRPNVPVSHQHNLVTHEQPADVRLTSGQVSGSPLTRGQGHLCQGHLWPEVKVTSGQVSGSPLTRGQCHLLPGSPLARGQGNLWPVTSRQKWLLLVYCGVSD